MSLTLSEFEARCLGDAPGEITPDDVIQAINRVSDLGEAYRKRLFDKAAKWKPEPRRRQVTRMAAKQCGIEKSLPRGDQDVPPHL